MHDLLELESRHYSTHPPTRSHPPGKRYQPRLQKHLSAWEYYMRRHPDGQFRRYIMTGIEQGFHIGFARSSPLRPAGRNHPSAVAHPSQVTNYIHAELEGGRLLELPPNASGCHTSPIGLIPKTHRPGKWRLIVDLSAPPQAPLTTALTLHYAPFNTRGLMTQWPP